MSDETKSEESETTEDEVGKLIKVGTDFISTVDVPASILRNVDKAFGQLCSAGVSWAVASLEGKAAEKREETEARIKIIRENADQIAREMKVNPEYARRAANKFSGKIIREQLNLDAVSAIAVDELNAEQPASSINQHANNDDEQTINDDWLNTFEEEARQISTEEMQTLFGRILAGEIRNPGSYSRRTVKILGELDQNTAALFKKLCSICVVLEEPRDERLVQTITVSLLDGNPESTCAILDIPDAKQVLDARVPSLGGNPGSNALIKYGLGFGQLNVLNEYGLIISNYNSWVTYSPCIRNEDNLVPLPFYYALRQWVLLPSSAWDRTQDFGLEGVALSQAGQELFGVVNPDPVDEYTDELKKFFAGQNLQMTEIQMP